MHFEIEYFIAHRGEWRVLDGEDGPARCATLASAQNTLTFLHQHGQQGRIVKVTREVIEPTHEEHLADVRRRVEQTFAQPDVVIEGK